MVFDKRSSDTMSSQIGESTIDSDAGHDPIVQGQQGRNISIALLSAAKQETRSLQSQNISYPMLEDTSLKEAREVVKKLLNFYTDSKHVKIGRWQSSHSSPTQQSHQKPTSM